MGPEEPTLGFNSMDREARFGPGSLGTISAMRRRWFWRHKKAICWEAPVLWSVRVWMH